MALPAEELRYTFADALTWEEEHFEIIEGEAYMMAPPLRVHQKIGGQLFRQISNYLDGKRCEVYPAPFAVRLFEEAETMDGIQYWSGFTREYVRVSHPSDKELANQICQIIYDAKEL